MEMNYTDEILSAIKKERKRQIELRASGKFDWTCADDIRSIARQSAPMANSMKMMVLTEEVGEVAKDIMESLIDVKRNNPHLLMTELIQVAAVAVAWCEALVKECQEEAASGSRYRMVNGETTSKG